MQAILNSRKQLEKSRIEAARGSQTLQILNSPKTKPLILIIYLRQIL